MKKLRLKKIVKREWNDFALIYLTISLIMVFFGSLFALYFGFKSTTLILISTPFWFWILIYLFEVKTEVYYEEVKES